MEINRRILVSLKQKILLLSLSTLLIPNVSHSTIAPEPGTGREFPEAFLEYKKNNPEKFRIKGGLKSKVERAKKARQDSKGKGQNQIEQGGLSSESSTSKAGPMPTAGLVSGTVSVPVILVQFSDVAATPPMNNPVTLQNILFGGAGTVTDYYNEVSYGNLSVTGSVSNLITLPGTAATYEGTTNGLPPPATLTLTGLLIKDALGGAGGADSTINFGAYDNDGPDGIPNSGDDDGVVDLIAFVQPKKGGECSGASIWSHRWQYRYWNGGTPYTTNDARSGGGFIQIDDYTVQPALNCSGTAPIEIGVFAHEFGHIFGIPDLYDTDSQPSQGLGYWSLMASGNWNTASQPAHWDAWSKSEVGWLTPTLLTSKITSLSIPQVETNPAAFEISISNSNYYLIENRQAVGFDANLQNCGLLIYRVDQATINNRTPSNQVNTVQNCGGFKQNTPDHYGIALAQADGLCQLEGNINRGDAGDPYPGSTSNLNFRNNTNPSSIDYEGNDPKVSVTTISNCAATMTANVDAFPLPTSAPGPVDVVFAVDISGSYVDDLPNIKAQMPAIVTKLRSAFINIRFGLASFKDFPFAPFGGSGDFAYLRNLALTTDSAAFLTAVNGLTAAGGGDTPESQYETIYQILTGAGRDLNNDGDKLDLGEISQQDMGWLTGRTKVIYLLTDAHFHDSDSETYPNTIIEAASRSTVRNLLAPRNPFIYTLVAEHPEAIVIQGEFGDPAPLVQSQLGTQSSELASDTFAGTLSVGPNSATLSEAIDISINSLVLEVPPSVTPPSPPADADIPFLPFWGLIVLAGMLASIGVRGLRK